MADLAPAFRLVHLGCRVNAAEADDVRQALLSAGAREVMGDEADLVIINTCAVTAEAMAKVRQAVRRLASSPARPCVLAFGCAVALDAEAIEALGERIFVEPARERVADRATQLLGLTRHDCAWNLQQLSCLRPDLKIQDGCDNRCAYCVVWRLRGHSRSMPASEVIERVRSLSALGAPEVVLAGIDLGAWHCGQDAGQPCDIAQLLRAILDRTDVERIRLSSVEPTSVSDELLEVMATSEGRIAPYLHLPLQSGSDAVLGRMGRRGSTDQYRRTIDQVRLAMPDCAIGCDVICGLPGESDADHEATMALAREAGFSHMHVFRYSARPDTRAATMDGQVPSSVASARAAQMRDAAAHLRRSYVAGLDGSVQQVVVEAPGRGATAGLVRVDTGEMACGHVVPVRVALAADGVSLCACGLA